MTKFFITTGFILFSLYSNSQELHVTCSEREISNGKEFDPTIVKTCWLKNFKIVSTGYPDYKGRYSYEQEAYVRRDEKLLKIKNSEIFNSSQIELDSIINKKIQDDYNSMRGDPDFKPCFDDIDSIPKYSIDEMLISFQGQEIWFSVSFGLTGACKSADGTIVSFNLALISKYLN
ncbi:MAG TPA: hypothetical protein VE933_14800 [Chitinophagaceae bacterium]|nr:hypothetical protein [Chitinophagaceae bacterium]